MSYKNDYHSAVHSDKNLNISTLNLTTLHTVKIKFNLEFRITDIIWNLRPQGIKLY